MSEHIHSRSARRKALEAERSKKKGKKPKRPKGLFKKIILAIFVIGLAGLLGGFGLFAYYASSAPKLDEELLKDPLSSELLDIHGNVFMKSGAEKRKFVPYADIPQEMQDAILATEDVRFYSHHGMDFWRLGGAVIANFRGGFGSQGASTLTQQVIKNSFLTDEKTLKRKAQEAWLAFQLERKYDKEEIFEMYFNKILMGGNNYGFGTAAEFYYGKNLNELELHEMAMLAGIPQSPNGYNPTKNPERAEKRRNIVLSLMYQHKKITKAEMEAAKAIPVTATLLPEDQRQVATTKYPAYVDLVLAELEEAGMSHLLAEGVKIQTALDPSAQQAVEKAINTSELYESDEMQAGMTVVDTKTGAIVAVGGGRNYSGLDWNFASDQKRQPGSTIKPILAYGPAIENLSWSTGNTIVDEPYNYKGTNQAIRNVDGKYQGTMTIREALYKSRNIPAVKVFEEVGTQKAGDFARNLGLPYDKLYSSDALGGGGNDFSTVQMAGAFAAFGNGGIYTKPHAIKKITFRDGKTERNMAPNPEIVMKDSTAYMITDILRDVLTSGTGTKANISGLDIAGKTGTTNYPNDIKQKHNMKNTDVPDSWFTGYTTNYTIAVWGGYAKYTTPITTYDRGRYVPQNLFRMVMSEISAGKETARFKKPGSVEEATIEYGSNPLLLASPTTPASMKRTELFVRGTVPTEMAKEEIIELEDPSNLSAQYDPETNSVSLNWTHHAPVSEAITGEVEFTVFVGVDGGDMQEMTKTKDMSVTFSGAEPGRTYVFSVVAKLGELESGPASATLQIDNTTEEIPGEEFDDGSENPDNEWNNGNWGNENNGNNGNDSNWNNPNNWNEGKNNNWNNGNWNNRNDGNGNNDENNPDDNSSNSGGTDSGTNTTPDGQEGNSSEDGTP
ncbi:PBP1A family penicillin-binding protein [Sporosarcina sp. ACRSM]|uniref:penicillin-binding protein 1A n=1 Tax=Sporosarcina sp. ACRSM TaxID=2918216 RepID=UPI001EF46511|nr:penicillin-binding protein 1A [Sporosarcina sp. ACRSM]MCG7333849.1 PBP1A family penicillin-binding protein [Sporosarcina sp. ACRSM]